MILYDSIKFIWIINHHQPSYSIENSREFYKIDSYFLSCGKGIFFFTSLKLSSRATSFLFSSPSLLLTFLNFSRSCWIFCLNPFSMSVYLLCWRKSTFSSLSSKSSFLSSSNSSWVQTSVASSSDLTLSSSILELSSITISSR